MELWGPLGTRSAPAIGRYSSAELETILSFLRLSTGLNEQRAAEIRAGLED